MQTVSQAYNDELVTKWINLKWRPFKKIELLGYGGPESLG